MYDLKYRPKIFGDVIGNEEVVKLLLIRSNKGKLANRSIMLSGPKGSGKTSIARIIAKAIVCDNLNNGDPCNNCSSCLSVIDETSDNTEEFDAATHGTVDRIRSIIDDLDYSTFSNKPRVLILDEAHRLSKASQDAMLKAIEDRRLVVIMCTTEPHNMRSAVRSRLDEYPISYPSLDVILSRMKYVCDNELVKYELDALRLIASNENCCPRTCLTKIEAISIVGDLTLELVKKYIGFSDIELLTGILIQLDSNPKFVIQKLNELSERESPSWIRDNLVLIISNAVKKNIGIKSDLYLNTDFFNIRGMRWVDLAKSLAIIEKPTHQNIEFTLISNTTIFAQISHGSTVGFVETFRPQKVELSKNWSGKSLEIEGIKFSSEENLTTLDDKIEIGTRGPDVITSGSNYDSVKFDPSHAPIPDTEFARAFIQRMQKSK